jgi:undecaprenyl-diphosphatase
MMKQPFRSILLLIVFFSLSYQVSAQKTGFDIHVLYEIKKTRTPFQTAFFKTISYINNPVCLAVPTALFMIGWIRKKRQRLREGFEVSETIALSQTLSFSLKILFGRLRPQLYDTAFVPLVYVINKSFPSGHTTEAVAMATAITLVNPKWYIYVPAYTWAILVAYSRMYLGVHFPTDILGGIVLGTASALVVWKINKMVKQRKLKKQTGANNV